MIRQYLSNTNENTTVRFFNFFLKLNKTCLLRAEGLGLSLHAAGSSMQQALHSCRQVGPDVKSRLVHLGAASWTAAASSPKSQKVFKIFYHIE